MKKSLFPVVLAVTVVLLGGCDFLRGLTGRPTSADIAAKKAVIELDKARHQARLDSLAAASKQASDSLALLDSIRLAGKQMRGSERLGGLGSSRLESRYYIVIGVFSNKDNASRLAGRALKAGITPVSIPCTNGCTAIAILPTDNIKDLYSAILSCDKYDFCPKDTWILVNE